MGEGPPQCQDTPSRVRRRPLVKGFATEAQSTQRGICNRLRDNLFQLSLLSHWPKVDKGWKQRVKIYNLFIIKYLLSNLKVGMAAGVQRAQLDIALNWGLESPQTPQARMPALPDVGGFEVPDIPRHFQAQPVVKNSVRICRAGPGVLRNRERVAGQNEFSWGWVRG